MTKYIINNLYNDEPMSKEFAKRADAMKYGVKLLNAWLSDETTSSRKQMIADYKKRRGYLPGIIQVMPRGC